MYDKCEMKTWLARLPGPFFCVVVLLSLVVSYPSTVMANFWGVEGDETLTTNPKERPVEVTATVPDSLPPTTPILIAPENNSLLNINQPVFSWYGCLSNKVSHYQIWLDGVLWFNNLPLVSHSTSQYSLTYSASSNIYELTPASGLDDGLHTWKIVVYDTSEYYADSTTWSFTIDTQAPVLVVTQVGGAYVTISSQDLDTVPDDPIKLNYNEPILKGTGEIGAQVHLSVIVPEHNNPTYLFTIGSSGTWQVDLPILPRDTVIELIFIITDPAGNVSALTGIKLIIVSQTLAVPLDQITTTPMPITKPQLLPPTVIDKLPQIIIPLVSPRELLFQIGEQVIQFMPTELQTWMYANPTQVDLTADKFQLSNWLALLVLILPAISATWLLSKQFGSNISLKHLIEVWRALGLWPSFQPQGLVIDSQTGAGLGFASLTLTGLSQRQEPITITKITNQSGAYDHFKPPAGEFRVTARQRNYNFPSLTKRAQPLGELDWYQGAGFKINQSDFEPGLVIPLDVQADLSPASVRQMRRREAWLKLASLSGPLRGLHFGFCLILTILWPTVWNVIALVIYIASVMQNLIKLKSQSLYGRIIDTKQIPLPWVSIIWQTQAGLVIGAFMTDKTGHFQSHGTRPDNSNLRIIKPHFWVTQSGTTNQGNVYLLEKSAEDTSRALTIILRQLSPA